MNTTECTIEEILGKSLEELQALTTEQLLELLGPSLKAQETIFAQLHEHKRAPVVNKASPGKLVSVQSIATKPVSAATYLKQGMSVQQATIAALTASGVRITPEMLEALKQQPNTP